MSLRDLILKADAIDLLRDNMKLQEIADKLGCTAADGSVEITAINSLDDAVNGEISFLTDKSYSSKLVATKASAAIVPKGTDSVEGVVLLYVDNVDEAVDILLQMFAPELEGPDFQHHPTAAVAPSAKLGKNVIVGPSAVIEKGVEIGDNTTIGAGSYIGQKVKIGSNCRIWPNVVVNHCCVIGDKVDINSNTSIGTDGFGYRMVDGKHKHIPHIGNVVIEDDVEIGANVCIDRAKFGSTVIGTGTKIDNLVQIAHNVKIGANSIIVSQVGIAGSCHIGSYVVLAGQVGMGDHAVVEDRVMVGPKSGIMQGQVVAAGSKVIGNPVQNFSDVMRQIAVIKKLPDMAKKVNKVLKQID